MPDEEDRPRDASSAADDAWADIVIPDDISALDRDIEAYFREQRHARRQARIQRWLDHRGALPLAIVAFAVVIAGLVATLLTVLAPKPVAGHEDPGPLATVFSRTGGVGGLLPAAVLHGPTGPIDTSTLRPAVLALVPPHCNCAPLLNLMAAEAFSVPLPLSVVVPAAADADAAKLQREIGHYTVDVYYDPNATLRKTFRPVGVEAVLVSGNGKVLDLRPVTVQNVANLDAPLQNLLLTPQASE